MNRSEPETRLSDVLQRFQPKTGIHVMSEAQVRSAIRSSLIIAITSFSISAFALASSLPFENLKNLPILLADTLPIVGSILSLIAAWICWRKHNCRGVYLLIGTYLVVLFGESIVTSGFGFGLGVTAFILTSVIAYQTLPAEKSQQVMLVGAGAGIAIIVIDLYIPAPNRIPASTALQIFASIMMGIVVILHLITVIRQFRNYTLRTKLILAIGAILLPAIVVLAIFYNYTSRAALTTSTNNALLVAAKQTANSVDDYLTNLITSLKAQAEIPTFRYYLKMSATLNPNSSEVIDTILLLHNLSQSTSALSYSLLDQDGNFLLDTTAVPLTDLPAALSLDKIDSTQIVKALTTSVGQTGSAFISPIIFPQNSDTPYYFIQVPVYDTNRQMIGRIMARHSAQELQDLIAKSNGLVGLRSFAVLLDDNFIRIAQGTDPDNARFKVVADPGSYIIEQLKAEGRLPALPAADLTTNIDPFKNGLINYNATHPFFSSQEVGTGNELNSAAIARMLVQPWFVVFMQPQSVALVPVVEQTRTSVIWAIIIVIAATAIAAYTSRLFVLPITRLTVAAQKVASGDLTVQTEVRTGDEIGTLTGVFNSMTAQLRQTLEGLENRVAERTSELAKASEQMKYRANQLQTVAEVAHAIASVQDPEQLPPKITRLISERFGYYHVGIFLLDDVGEFVVLQAANSEGGQRMLARGHRLKVSETSMVGYVAEHGEARIALDVGKDAVFFDNPDLPQTRSEMALPLLVGERLIGILDVQSDQSSAFTSDDVALLGTLTDQVAIAIENARLFSETRQALTELETTQRLYLQQEWTRLASEHELSGYTYATGKLVQLPITKKSDIWDSVKNGEPTTTMADALDQQDEAAPRTLAVPITLRGQTIGVFNLEKTEQNHLWSEEEINLVKTIADQVATALENTRLLEETQRRAARDRLVSEISDKMRRAVDMDTLIQTAVREMATALGVPETFVQLGPPPRIEDAQGNGKR